MSELNGSRNAVGVESPLEEADRFTCRIASDDGDRTESRAPRHEDLGRRAKSQGEIEAAVCEGVARFMQTYMGRGPKAIHAHLVTDLVVVRVQGVLTAAEQHLFLMLEPHKGRDLFKGLRTQLVESSRARLGAVIEAACEMPSVSMHHDISTVTGEEIFVFRLTESPVMRPPKGSDADGPGTRSPPEDRGFPGFPPDRRAAAHPPCPGGAA